MKERNGGERKLPLVHLPVPLELAAAGDVAGPYASWGQSRGERMIWIATGFRH